jgi:hypothetical protein
MYRYVEVRLGSTWDRTIEQSESESDPGDIMFTRV